MNRGHVDQLYKNNSEQKRVQGELILHSHSLLWLIKIIQIWQETSDIKLGQILERLNMTLLFIMDSAQTRT